MQYPAVYNAMCNGIQLDVVLMVGLTIIIMYLICDVVYIATYSLCILPFVYLLHRLSLLHQSIIVTVYNFTKTL